MKTGLQQDKLLQTRITTISRKKKTSAFFSLVINTNSNPRIRIARYAMINLVTFKPAYADVKAPRQATSGGGPLIFLNML